MKRQLTGAFNSAVDFQFYRKCRIVTNEEVSHITTDS